MTHLGEAVEYSKDLFGILVSMLEGEPKNMVEGMVDKNPNHYCGFRALLMLNKRYGYKTVGSLLRMIMEVMAPGVLKPNDVVGGIVRWEN